LLRTNEERYRASWGALGPQRADPYAGPVAGSAQPADDPGRWSEPLRAAEAGADAAAVAATAPDVVLFAGTDREAALSSLASLRACTPGSRIVVVDDAAHLATPEWAQAVAGLEVLDGMGAGRAAGFNAGLEATATDEVCLVSSEVVVSRGWLDGLAAALASDDAVAAVGPVAPGLYGQSIDAAYLDLEEYGRLAAAYNHSDPSKWSRVLRLSDGCLLVRRSAVEKVGGLDENYTTGTLAGDDLCLRLLTGGFTLSRCADVLVHHRGTAVVQPGEARFAEIERLGFEARWGFSPTYSMIPRYEVVALLDRPGPLSVLELGCACGATLLEIANRFPGSEVHGLEFNERAAEVAACVAHARYGDAEAPLDYPAASFDYVICADVLEHLHEPWQVLAGLRPLLKPGGKVIASIPNLMHIGVLARLLRGRFTYEDAGILDRTHLRFFTLAEIDDMFAGAGYPSRSYTATRIPLGAAEAQLAESLAATFAVDQAQYLAYQYLVVAGV
jgi:GT2 family glycosyltransferase